MFLLRTKANYHLGFFLSLFLPQVNASRADCGNVEGPYYKRDIWDRKLAQCVYRKCAPACPTLQEQEREIFSRPEINYEDYSRIIAKDMLWNRTAYCCTENLCNAGAKLRIRIGLVVVSLCSALLVVLI